MLYYSIVLCFFRPPPQHPSPTTPPSPRSPHIHLESESRAQHSTAWPTSIFTCYWGEGRRWRLCRGEAGACWERRRVMGRGHNAPLIKKNDTRDKRPVSSPPPPAPSSDRTTLVMGRLSRDGGEMELY